MGNKALHYLLSDIIFLNVKGCKENLAKSIGWKLDECCYSCDNFIHVLNSCNGKAKAFVHDSQITFLWALEH